MGAAYFYHLTDTPLERTLPMLLGKCRAAGWRVAVRGAEAALLERLDATLWNDGFLPHGMAGGLHDAEQPVLLGVDVAAEGFACLMSVGGADVTSAEVGTLERTCVLFDGHDDAALHHARGQWKALTSQGCKAQYWAQDDGRWVMKAEA
ncbi:MAG: DNA polymerase III subunit chi [Pseudomonadota bacterium]